MLLLGIDTATLTLSAALVERDAAGADRLLGRLTVPPPTPHSSVLPARVEAMLAEHGVSPRQLNAVVVGRGPGSFTGLRISLALAKGLCYAAQVPLVGVSSLAAMALAAAPDVACGALLVPCLDARKGEVYAGFFRRVGEAVAEDAPEAVLPPAALLERLQSDGGAAVFGIGREAYPTLTALPVASTLIRTPDAWSLVRLARELPAFSKQAVFAVEPHYVRPSEAEWTARPKKQR